MSKILYLTKVPPNPESSEAGYKISFNLLKYLASSHDVRLLSFVNCLEDRVYVKQFPLKLDQVVTVQTSPFWKALSAVMRPTWSVLTSLRYDYRFRRELRAILLGWEPGVVFLEFTQMARYIADIRRFAPRAITVIYEHDVSAQMAARRARQGGLLSRLFWEREARLLAREEPILCSEFDLVCTPTTKDALLLTELGVNEEHVAKICTFKPEEKDRGAWRDPGNSVSPTLLFFGGLSRYENVDAVQRLVYELLPQLRNKFPGITLKVVGGGGRKLREEFAGEKAVVFTGYVESILDEALSCQLALFPLRLGAGVKIKVLEAMSWGMPVVTTSVGAEGIGATDGYNLSVCDSDSEIVMRAVQLLKDSKRRIQMGLRGKELREREFDFEADMMRLESLIRKPCAQEITNSLA